jgi:hypothetical protein
MLCQAMAHSVAGVGQVAAGVAGCAQLHSQVAFNQNADLGRHNLPQAISHQGTDSTQTDLTSRTAWISSL